MQCKKFGICRYVILSLVSGRQQPKGSIGTRWARRARIELMNDPNHTTEQLIHAHFERFLHPRMTSEHVNSGGGLCMSPRIRSLLPGLRFAGWALTARTLAGFTGRAIEALSLAKPDDVLVIDAGGPSELSVWGSMVHWNATRNG